MQACQTICKNMVQIQKFQAALTKQTELQTEFQAALTKQTVIQIQRDKQAPKLPG